VVFEKISRIKTGVGGVMILLILVFILVSRLGCKDTSGLVSSNLEGEKYQTTKSLPIPSAFFDGGIESYEICVDNKGIPLKDGGYHPSFIAQYGLGLYMDYYKNNSEDSKIKLKRVADWLSDNIVDEGDYSVWYFPFDVPHFECYAPCQAVLLMHGVLAFF